MLRSPDPLRATTAGDRERASIGRASAHQFVDNEHGHNYTQVGGPVDPSVCALSLSDIHSRLRERVRCQRARDFGGANAVEDELKAAGVNFDNNAKLWRADGRSYGFQIAAKRKELGVNIPMVAGCPSLKKAVDLTHGHLDLLTPRQIAAFWAAAPALLQKEGATSGRHDASTLEKQLESILIRTLEDMGTYRPKDASTTALGLARLVKAVGDPSTELPVGGAHRILRDLLVGDGGDRQRFIFQTIAEAVPSLQEFDARDVSNFIYADAEAHLPLFEKIARHVLEKLSARIADRIVLPVTDTEGGGRSLGGQALNKFGHDFTKVGGPVDPSVCTLKEAEIHKLLRERMVFRTTGIYAKQ
ncbi:hypothetical protein ACHAXT_002145 [Thalassiosira profunda]